MNEDLTKSRCCPTSSCFDSSSRHRCRAAHVSLESSLVSLAFSRIGSSRAQEKKRITFITLLFSCIQAGKESQSHHRLCLEQLCWKKVFSPKPLMGLSKMQLKKIARSPTTILLIFHQRQKCWHFFLQLLMTSTDLLKKKTNNTG